MEERQMDTLDQYLESELAKDAAEETIELENNEKKSKKRKGIIISIIALCLAGVTAFTTFLIKGKNKVKVESSKTPTTSTVDDIEEDIKNDIDLNTLSLSDLGIELEIELESAGEIAQKNEYVNPSGNINKDKIVEKDGTLWVSEEAAEKADEIGKVVINGETVSSSNGNNNENNNVTTNQIDYVIKDEKGKEITSGNIEVSTKRTTPDGTVIPYGYAWDEGRNEIVPEEDVGKYVYDSDGDLVFANKQTQNSNTTTTTTSKTSTTTTTSPKSTTTTSASKNTTTTTTQPTTTQKDSLGGLVNADGTYTIYGTTYMNKETFEAFILDEDSSLNFGYLNGIIYPKSYLDELVSQSQIVK